MSRFLYGRALSKKINKLLSENCTCIVSYIGKGTTQKIKKIKEKSENKKIKIICNFHSNGTNPYEIETLIKHLGPEKVKQMDSFHAKVYFSDSGAIICSANLSTNGLELFDEPARQLEAGVFIENNEPAYAKVLEWHKSLYDKLREIKPQEISERKNSYIRTGNRIKSRKPTEAIELTVEEFLNYQDKFGLYFYLNNADIDVKRDTISDMKINQTIKEYMEKQHLDDWTQEEYASSKRLDKAINIIREKILLGIFAEINKNNFPVSSKKLKIDAKLLKFDRHHNVKMEKNNEDAVVFFYIKNEEYKTTSKFKTALAEKFKKSLKDKNKRRDWEKWLKSPESDGWFMTIDTLKKLITIE